MNNIIKKHLKFDRLSKLFENLLIADVILYFSNMFFIQSKFLLVTSTFSAVAFVLFLILFSEKKKNLEIKNITDFLEEKDLQLYNKLLEAIASNNFNFKYFDKKTGRLSILINLDNSILGIEKDEFIENKKHKSIFKASLFEKTDEEVKDISELFNKWELRTALNLVIEKAITLEKSNQDEKRTKNLEQIRNVLLGEPSEESHPDLRVVNSNKKAKREE